MNKENDNQTPQNGSENPSSHEQGLATGDLKGLATGIRKIVSGIASGLGLIRGKTDGSGAESGDVTTSLAHQRTNLAMDRSYLAADRTLMAWIRTSLSMISFGFTIGKLGQVIESVELKMGFFVHGTLMSVQSIAFFLTILGTLSLLVAAFQHRTRMSQLRSMGMRMSVSLSFIVSLVLVVVGGFALSSLILAL